MTKVIINPLQSKFLRLGKTLLWTVAFILCFSSLVIAADEKPKPANGNSQRNEKPQPEQFKPNPLELKIPDPLLPRKKEPLTPEERSQLRASLDQLNTQATGLLQANKPDEAFDIWYRELRLRRVLGSLEEVTALGRVGTIAWENSRKFDSNVISQRLLAIQQEAEQKKTMNLELLQALAPAYQQVRLPEPAIKAYQQILADQRQRADAVAQEETLKTIAQLQMAWFDYPNAAATYEELLALATAKGDRVNEVNYLQQLVYIYEKAQKPENALRQKQRLAEAYLNQKNYTNLPALKIAIAGDYEALKQLDLASQTYQEAYSLAWSLQQFAHASEALGKLGALYRSHNQPESALQVYDVLLKSAQQSYDYYALMKTYDQMGQIYLEQKKYPQALAAFQNGLALAKSLQYQENYFATQIDRVTQQSSQ